MNDGASTHAWRRRSGTSTGSYDVVVKVAEQLKPPVPSLEARYRVIPPALDARLLAATDDSLIWGDLARELDVKQVKATRRPAPS